MKIDVQTVLAEIDKELEMARSMKDSAENTEDKFIYWWVMQWLLYSKILIRNVMIKNAKPN